ncbi:helix-turn-helix transcriptional regulator [Escherichia coli]|nr:helix-turn-helix transcriptional regulator [Escherichia coli]
MSLVKLRTNKLTILYTGNHEISITDVSDKFNTVRKKNSIVIVGRNVRISVSTEFFVSDFFRNAIFFDYAGITTIKRILTLTYNSDFNNPFNFDTISGNINKIVSFSADDECIRDYYDEIKSSHTMHDSILNFFLLCKKAEVENKVFPLVYSSAVNTFCNKIIDTLESDISKKWTLQLLSEKFNLSEITIRKKLELEGVKFKELMLEIKMKTAISMLIGGKKSISQIGNELGYKNISYFILLFKDFFGLTPKQFQLSFIR